MRERNGVRLGQKVRDLDGKPLGKVTALYDWGFSVVKGLPFLVRSDHVVRYDEVRAVRDGELVVARSSRDLFELAAGDIPSSWRIPVPPDYPAAATPPEARLLRADLARGAISTDTAPSGRPAAQSTPITAAEEREYARTRGQAVPAAAPHAPSR
jgi:hypothetical protein